MSKTDPKLSNRDNTAFLHGLSIKRLKLIEQGHITPELDEAAVIVRYCNSIELANELCLDCPVNKERKRIIREKKNT